MIFLFSDNFLGNKTCILCKLRVNWSKHLLRSTSQKVLCCCVEFSLSINLINLGTYLVPSLNFRVEYPVALIDFIRNYLMKNLIDMQIDSV